MQIKYVYRIDDVHPSMMWKRFFEIMSMMEDNGVVPLLGVIPDNRDKSLMFDRFNPEFFDIIRSLKDSGKAIISQHGYQHTYITMQNSVNQVLYGRVKTSEFVGIPYLKQFQMIKSGKEILESRGIFTDIWMAPSHTNDRNTFRALKELGFRYVTDGIALNPYRRQGLIFVPQQIWRPGQEFPFKFGVFTICLHLNNLTEDRIALIAKHLHSGNGIVSFYDAAETQTRWFYPVCDTVYKLRCAAAHLVIRPLRRLRK